MSEAKEILNDIIQKFSPEKFTAFFREKTRKYTPLDESFSRYNDDNFKEGIKLGELSFPEDKTLLVSAFKMSKDLTERSGKKAQYEKAKKILKDNQKYSSGIFIFHDPKGSFRFSLVYEEPAGTKRKWSSFRRFTYFASSELTNKTFLQRIGEGDFSELNAIKEAFSVEKVTKEFYQQIANWYFWAVDSCKFPEGAEEETNGRQMAVIRMITRLIFIWFMRERKLVPTELFTEENIKKILKSFSPEESTYYKAVLQNLFFATLSTRRDKRKFRTEHRYKGINNDFGNQYVFRYHELFENPDKLQEYFNSIPFLNGGLFECLDEGRNNNHYVDGFTARKEFQPKVPNFLFFSPEEKVDLNRHYGTKSKTYRVRGLLDILSSFNFTIDENSPYDADVALDPELLGRVFENLLASFNPETSTTARKATGSYYTPREIVDYMVDESLKAYFKTHLESIDDKLENLFDVSNEENPLSEKESRKLVDLIENVRIVDPAVGSGAFPMGVLNKLVSILNKIDPGNKRWKEAQLKAAGTIPDPSVRKEAKDKIDDFFARKNIDYLRKLYLIQRCIYGVDIQQIAVEIAKLRFFISLLVDERVEEDRDNSGIEPLPNLEFKIMQGNSLVSEFLGIDLDAEDDDTEGELFAPEDGTDELVEELKSKKDEYLNRAGFNDKRKLKQEIEDLIIEIFEKKLKKQKADYFNRIKAIEERYGDIKNKDQRESVIQAEKDKLYKKSGFNLEQYEDKLRQFTSGNKLRPFFPWKLYFAEVFHEKGGFDVVIANPPYIKERENKEVFKPIVNTHWGKKWHQGKMDYWYYFLHKGIELIQQNGVISFITSRYWLNSAGAKKLIQRVKSELSFTSFVDIGKLKVFNEVAGHHMVAVYIKNKEPDHLIYKKLENDVKYILDENHKVEILMKNDIFSENNEILLTKTKQFANVINLGSVCDVSQGVIEAPDKISRKALDTNPTAGISVGMGVFVLTEEELIKLKLNEAEKEIVKKYLDPGDVFRYGIKKNVGKYLLYSDREANEKIRNNREYIHVKNHLDKFERFITSSNKPYGLHRPRKIKYFLNEKIVFKNMFLVPEFAFDSSGLFFGLSFSSIIEKDKGYSLKYILAILNSQLAYYWYQNNCKKRGAGFDVGVQKIREFPIKRIRNEKQKPFIDLVENIIVITNEDDYLKNPAKQAKVSKFEKQIDQHVNELYELSPKETAVVEGKY